MSTTGVRTGVAAMAPEPSAGRVPFCPGDRLSRAEFERRYEGHPEIKKAELIEGVVHMPTPVPFEEHALPHGSIITWLGTYQAATPGVLLGDNATVRLDLENEVQPDALLRLDSSQGGQSTIGPTGYVEGPPELVVEVAASSASYDLHSKRRVYARTGVQEYLAIQMYEHRVDWFVLREGVYGSLKPEENGVIRSEVFPGLWLRPTALWAGDLSGMLALLREGIESAQHEAFVASLRGPGSEA